MYLHKNKFSFINYYRRDFTVIKIVGGCILNDQTPNKKLWGIYLTISNIFFPVLVNIAQILHLFEVSSITKIATSGYIIAVCCMGSVKSFLIFKHRKQFLSLISSLEEPKFMPRNKEQRKMACESLMLYSRVKYMVLAMCTMAVMSSMITPIFSYRERRLPFTAWYPVDINPAPIYVLVYIHQCISDFYITYMNVYTDIISAGFTTFAGIQCDFLCYNLINMKEEETEEALRACIEHHKLILRFAKTTEKVFSQIYFGQFAASTAAFSMTLFLITLIDKASFEFFYLVMYQSSMFSLLLIPCWFSSEMKRKSENIPNAVYSCPWINSSKSLKKDLLYFIHFAQTPITLFAIGFFQISVETFVLIVRSSFAYYTLLNNLNMQIN